MKLEKALIIMTRVPIPGKTKTRLMPHLTPAQCAKLHICFLKDIYNTAQDVKADILVYYTPEDYRETLCNILENEVRLIPQKGSSLGERMYNSIKETLEKGYKKCVLIGSDIPNITSDVINKAFEVLDSSDIVIGPTFDGGYYLIGMNKPVGAIFENIFYGTGTVYEKTLYIMDKLSLKYSEIKKCRDIDTYEDLLALSRSMSEIRKYKYSNTGKFIAELGLLNEESGEGLEYVEGP